MLRPPPSDDLPVDIAVLGGGSDDILLVDTPGLFREHPDEAPATAEQTSTRNSLAFNSSNNSSIGR